MPGLRLILIGWVVLMLVGLFALLKSRRRGGPMLTGSGRVPGLEGSLGAGARRGDYVGLGREALSLLEAGRREEAVALVRGRTGLAAAEADAVVVRLEKLMKRLGT